MSDVDSPARSDSPGPGNLAGPGLGRRIINPVYPAVIRGVSVSTDMIGLLKPAGGSDPFEGRRWSWSRPFRAMRRTSWEAKCRLPRRRSVQAAIVTS